MWIRTSESPDAPDVDQLRAELGESASFGPAATVNSVDEAEATAT